MSLESDPTRIDELIEKHYLGTLDVEEQAELAKHLKADRNARDRFRNAAHIDAELRYLSSGQAPQVVTPADALGKPRWRRWLPLIAASLLCVITAIWYSQREPHSIQQNNGAVTAGRIATLTTSHRAEFEEAFAPQDGTFMSGQYRLNNGAITMTFINGVSVSIEGPARFSLVDSMRMQLDVGRVRAFVPESGHGFVIATPQMKIEDLGTEFGVLVDPNQNSEVHVFAGEVNLHQDNQPPELVSEETAVAWDASRQRRNVNVDGSAFATRTSIGFRNWLDHSQRLRSDPSAILYFDFEKESAPNAITNRAANQDMPRGIVRGSIWATGRWPGKGSLMLETPGDRVELNVPGKYESVTIMAWMQLNRLDEPLQTFFNTRDYNQGEHHWNLNRNGALDVGVSQAYKSTSAAKLPLGRWTHVAAVLDRPTGSAYYFIDGKEVAKVTEKLEHPLTFGECSIGAFGRTLLDKTAPNQSRVDYSRELRGRIDEFALFSRALSHQEIQQAFDAGKGF